MKKLSVLLSAAGLAALVSLPVATSASAAPIGGMQNGTGSASADVLNIHYRGYGHCHWRNGRKWCHGDYNRRRHYDGYGYRPGVYLRFGFGGDRYRHRRNNWR